MNIVNHKGTVTLETDRLVLRKYKITDADDMFNNWATRENVTRYLTWTPYTNVDDVKCFLNYCISQYDNEENYNWCIELKENSQAIGSISVVSLRNDIDEASVGYCLGEDYWHKGIMTEAFTKVIDFLFNEIGVNRIEATHDTRNPNSGKVMAKCGLLYEGTRKQGAVNVSGICDSVIYGLTKEDYKKKCNGRNFS